MTNVGPRVREGSTLPAELHLGDSFHFNMYVVVCVFVGVGVKLPMCESEGSFISFLLASCGSGSSGI